MTAVRTFALSAWLSYRALFTWLNPWGYISTRIVAPIVLALLFGALGRFADTGVERPVVGGALLAVALAAVYGMSLAVNNERNFGTLELRLIAPEGQLLSLAGKAVPHVIDGMLNGALTLTVAAAVFDVTIGLGRIGPLLLTGLVAATSCTGIGLVAAAIGVRTRDTFTAPNVIDMTLTLLSGAFIAPARLPLGLEHASDFFPLHRAVDAALTTLDTGQIAWSLLAQELAVGLAWGLAGHFFLRWMIQQARRKATLHLL